MSELLELTGQAAIFVGRFVKKLSKTSCGIEVEVGGRKGSVMLWTGLRCMKSLDSSCILYHEQRVSP